MINNRIYEVASLKFTQFFEDKNNRSVIMHEDDSSDNQLDLFTCDTFKFRSIMTNDRESSEKMSYRVL